MALQHRDNFVPKKNIYLFGVPKSLQPICGYKIISKYAKLAGTKNPQAISATKLRKHLATLTQVINMTENDIEQLSKFMGHTVGIHRGSYRLPDDIYQTAKISKLLLLMEKGQASRYKGKNLDEIDINLECDDISDDDIDPMPADIQPVEDQPGCSQATDYNNSQAKSNLCSSQKQVKRRILIPWTTDQKVKARQYFSSHIKNKIPPKRHECETLIENEKPLFDNKEWVKIKVFIQNEYMKNKKR